MPISPARVDTPRATDCLGSLRLRASSRIHASLTRSPFARALFELAGRFVSSWIGCSGLFRLSSWRICTRILHPPVPAESVPRSRIIAESGLVDHDAISKVAADAVSKNRTPIKTFGFSKLLVLLKINAKCCKR